jgi:hypothetical protein
MIGALNGTGVLNGTSVLAINNRNIPSSPDVDCCTTANFSQIIIILDGISWAENLGRFSLDIDLHDLV